VLKQMLEKKLLLTAGLGASLSKVECGCAQQQIDELQCVGRARVEPTNACDHEPASYCVDRVRHIALERDGWGRTSTVSKYADDLLLIDDLSQNAQGELLVGTLTRVRMTPELGGDVPVLAICDVAAKPGILRREEQVQRCLGKLQPSVSPPTCRLVEACPVQLIAEVVRIAQPLDIADEMRRVDELQNADSEEPVTGVNDAGLIEKDRGGGVVLREATNCGWEGTCRHSTSS
jgi:hypothetical protein